MTSGEADAALNALRSGTTLDSFTKCRIEGCDVMVHLSGDGICHAHGARDGIPEYLTSVGDGAILYALHVSFNFGGDCE